MITRNKLRYTPRHTGPARRWPQTARSPPWCQKGCLPWAPRGRGPEASQGLGVREGLSAPCCPASPRLAPLEGLRPPWGSGGSEWLGAPQVHTSPGTPFHLYRSGANACGQTPGLQRPQIQACLPLPQESAWLPSHWRPLTLPPNMPQGPTAMVREVSLLHQGRGCRWPTGGWDRSLLLRVPAGAPRPARRFQGRVRHQQNFLGNLGHFTRNPPAGGHCH